MVLIQSSNEVSLKSGQWLLRIYGDKFYGTDWRMVWLIELAPVNNNTVMLGLQIEKNWID